MKSIFRAASFLILSIGITLWSCNHKQKHIVEDAPEVQIEPVDYINPFIGTGAHGHTYPGATVPFGMVQLSPDTRLEGWDGCSGYHYTDSIIYGFSHTHLQGTGVPDYGDILFQPTNGKLKNAAEWRDSYKSVFTKESERAEAGYYRVILKDFGIEAELTATDRCGIHRYKFQPGDTCQLFIDMMHRDELLHYDIQTVGDSVIYGYRVSKGWAEEQHVYFYAVFSKPFYGFDQLMNQSVSIDPKTGEKTTSMWMEQIFRVGFANPGELVVRVGLSGTDVEGAKKNLEAEAPHNRFNEYRAVAREKWRNELASIQHPPLDNAENENYFTALYHCFTTPNLFSDVDGRYRGMDKKIHTAVGYNRYTVFSLWDTFRAYHPLMNKLQPARTRDWIVTFLEMYKERGELPVWELAGNETYCMIGYHSIPVITHAYLEGIQDFDTDLALEAMIASATGPQQEKKDYDLYGYVPGDKHSESVSKTLEFAYDDYCIARFARALDKPDVYKRFLKRSQNWKNVFDPETGFMRARRNGGFTEPFDPFQVNFNYTEANSWQYSLFVPHDMMTLMTYLGGKDSLLNWMDQLFHASEQTTGREQADITGLIGQYAHGNEPSHHVAFLYDALSRNTNRPTHFTDSITKNLYHPTPEGLCGNEDCGQMSAWYIMALMDHYYLNPDCILRTGANAEIYPETYFLLGETSRVFQHLITPAPIIRGPQTSFTSRTNIEIDNAEPGVRTKVELIEEGSDPKTFIYSGPFSIENNCTVNAWAEKEGYEKSKLVTASYVKRNADRKVKSISKYDAQYAAGGDEAMIDGMRGGTDFRTMHWQGFHGMDVEIVVDLGKSDSISFISLSSYQETRPWIWTPSEVDYYLSRDGINFYPAGKVKTSIAQDDHAVKIHEFILNITPQRARYVKAVARPAFDEIPEWHLGAGGKPWIFLDELIIR